MRDTKPNRQDRTEEANGTPGFGLGFDMRNVIERSRGMELKRATVADGRTEARHQTRQDS
ncbi:hypothetical protein PCS_02920 [Desulfocurvibacter africanus PCS]|uniref:Uncharacterized protein n=1 Tax=Desulfocurvibacter africanus PCS TaxID=1262666 RepID=M5Q056_DESAF|nr:hypothetical protein [Desulfocurvibacter africanus]EMG36416.1 hypothetical protein PCS_02920 [Desulfocurvibacter africanus PCS]